MKYYIKGLKKKSNEKNTILFLIGISEDKKIQDILVKDQEMVKSILMDLEKKCRLFDIQGEMVEVKGKPILMVSSFTRELSPTQSETRSSEEDDIDKANEAMSECIQPEEDIKTPDDAIKDESKLKETSEIEAVKEIETVKEESPIKDVTVHEIKIMPIIGYPVTFETQYFKGYKTLDDLLEELNVPNKKTLKFY